MSRLEHLNRFYSILERLQENIGGARKLADCTWYMDWPGRGVYFFFESGEKRSDTGAGPRVIRVGTHALKAGSGTKLWTRLSQHRGQLSTGRGNHRGSVFRLIVGAALIKRHSYSIPNWGVGSSANTDIRAGERILEQEVSQAIGAISFIWLAVQDEAGPESGRGCIERNAIALLSNYNKSSLDPASKNWLGNDCDRERVRNSGLWNQNHVDENYDPAFLDRFDRLVSEVRRPA
jgi:hypothetical protein